MIIANFCNGKFFDQFIWSLKSQTCGNMEVIFLMGIHQINHLSLNNPLIKQVNK